MNAKKQPKMLLLDLDGTLYRDTQPIEGGLWLVRECQRLGIPYGFLTNNSMRTQKENARHMEAMGYEAIDPALFFNSAMASAKYAKKNYGGQKAWYLGADGMKEALEQEGYEISEDHPDLVFVGLDKRADYSKYSKALAMLLDGAVLIGTNKDRILAKPGGFEVGNGSVVALFEYATKTKSPDIAKPARPILDMALEYFGKNKEDVILIGDNLETDIALGYNNQVKTVFVQSGVHHREDIPKLNIRPDVAVNDLRELDLIKLTAN